MNHARPLKLQTLVLLAALATFAALLLPALPARADIDWPEAATLKKLQMKKVDVRPFTITYSPRWQFLIDYLRKSPLPAAFVAYIKKEYGMAYAPFAPNKSSNNKPDTPLISAFLFPDLASVQATINNPAIAAAIAGFANSQFVSVRLDPAYTPPASLAGAAKDSFIEAQVLPMFLHEAFHVVSMRECGKLISGLPNPDFSEMNAEFLGPMWFAEGFPDNVAMAVNPAGRAYKYKAFYYYFVDKKYHPTFESLWHAADDGDLTKMPLIYLMGSMMVEYLRLKMGTPVIKKLFETSCHTQKSPEDYRANRKAIQGGLDDNALWDATYKEFETNRAAYQDLLK